MLRIVVEAIGQAARNPRSACAGKRPGWTERRRLKENIGDFPQRVNRRCCLPHIGVAALCVLTSEPWGSLQHMHVSRARLFIYKNS
jgi:hypothetical protein